ncbi:family 16 glycosylhydrolase [Rhodococcus sp. NPDC003318]|uniref:glycoside hydrolase family 16 protein n=1 Tax=Rhodococcus sp. NPDC003318 TaxID=3364503 RepID=UPI0036C3F1D6
MSARALRAVAAAAAVAACASCTIPTGEDNPAPTSQTQAAAATADVCFQDPTAGGIPVPTGDLPGWKQIFTDEFDRCDLGGKWSTYSGQPGGNPLGWWDGSMVSLHDGTLDLQSQRTSDGWVSGGVSNYPVTQQYGRWEIRMRADRSDDISYHMLLWPQREHWPPEIDFSESVSGDRTAMDAFLHWPGENGEDTKANAEITGDFSQWHTVGVEWGPGIIRYLLDGKVWAEAHSDVMVPDEPMWLGMQAEAGACERRADWGLAPCSDSDALRPDRVSVQVDWVAVYEPVMPELEAMQKKGAFDPLPDATQLTENG